MSTHLKVSPDANRHCTGTGVLFRARLSVRQSSAHTATMLPVILAVGKAFRRSDGTTVYSAGAVYRLWAV